MYVEWDGATSNKFQGGKKITGPASQAELGMKGLIGETNTGIEELKGRRHFDVPECTTVIEWKPCFKKVKNKNDQMSKTTGLKKIEFNVKPPKPRAEKKHTVFAPIANKNRPEMPFNMKTVLTEDGKRVQDVPTDEYDFHEKLMGKKKLVPELDDKRNQLSIRALGDKSYKKVEHDTDFYKPGGLITGSTNVQKIPHQGRSITNNDFATVISYESTGPNRTKWNDRVKMMRTEEENQAVGSLIEWEKTVLKESNPKYVDPDISDGD
ncbi:unnamed protein product [Blepharisma stoltei]|uniref:Uncharacterized protein n=1 Tax=Blepharisma stoltei TaxID=1481888 RepID=A0AAU9JX36_9CILI|nr:unnamed protein product [Blepharisma stoltei]